MGIQVEIVTAGGTGSYELSALHDGVTELQAGGGVFMDVMYRRKCHVEALTPALTVLTSVTSRAADRVVVDAGFKTLSSSHQPPEVLGRDDLRLRGLSAEHGIFDIVEGQDRASLGRADRIARRLFGFNDLPPQLLRRRPQGACGENMGHLGAGPLALTPSDSNGESR